MTRPVPPMPGPSDAVTRPLFLVYLAKQGTFYPFAPTGNEQRDTELELRLRGMLADDLPVEPDLSRWFPIWDLPSPDRGPDRASTRQTPALRLSD